MGKRRKRKNRATIFELFGRKKSNIEKVAEMIEEQHIYNQRVKAVFGTLGYLQGVDENAVSGEDFKRLVYVVEELADIVFGGDVDFDTVTDQYIEDDTDEIVSEDLLFRKGAPTMNMLNKHTSIDEMIMEDAINESMDSRDESHTDDEFVSKDILFRKGNGPAKNMLKENTAIDRMIREDAINESIESNNDL